MANASTMVGDYFFAGNVTGNGIYPSPNTVTKGTIPPNAGIEASKVQQQTTLNYSQPHGTAVVAATVPLTVIQGTTGVTLKLDCAITGLIATGADRTVDVDVQKGNAGTGFATILTATVHFTNASVLRAVVSGTFTAATFAAGDQLILVVTVAGAAGAQAQGLVATLTIRQDPQ